MKRGTTLPERDQKVLREMIKAERLEDLEARLGVSAQTLARAAAGATLNKSSLTLLAHVLTSR